MGTTRFKGRQTLVTRVSFSTSPAESCSVPQASSLTVKKSPLLRSTYTGSLKTDMRWCLETLRTAAVKAWVIDWLCLQYPKQNLPDTPECDEGDGSGCFGCLASDANLE